MVSWVIPFPCQVCRANLCDLNAYQEITGRVMAGNRRQSVLPTDSDTKFPFLAVRCVEPDFGNAKRRRLMHAQENTGKRPAGSTPGTRTNRVLEPQTLAVAPPRTARMTSAVTGVFQDDVRDVCGLSRCPAGASRSTLRAVSRFTGRNLRNALLPFFYRTNMGAVPRFAGHVTAESNPPCSPIAR